MFHIGPIRGDFVVMRLGLSTLLFAAALWSQAPPPAPGAAPVRTPPAGTKSAAAAGGATPVAAKAANPVTQPAPTAPSAAPSAPASGQTAPLAAQPKPPNGQPGAATAQSVEPAPAQAVDPAAAQRASIERMQASIAAQMQAVRKQVGDQAAESGSFIYRAAVLIPPQPSSCPPAPVGDVDAIITRAATAEGLEPDLIRAVIEQESAFQPCAVSPKGAMGMMQLMPATAQQFGVRDPFDPSQNIAAGSRFLKQLLTRYSDLSLALAAYNSGPGRVDDAQAVPNIEETKNYVGAILKRLGRSPASPASVPQP